MSEEGPKTCNIDKLKFYISQSDDPIPDITHSQVDIFSEFKFYFNDDELQIFIEGWNQERTYLLHDEGFQQEIKEIYIEWMTSINCQQQKERTNHKNFIAFIENWINISQEKHKDNFHIEYPPFQQHQKQNHQQQQIDTTQFRQKLNEIIKSKEVNTKEKKGKKKSTPLQKQNRMKLYFRYFSSSHQHVNSSDTFEQLGVVYSTMDLSQWVRFSKDFVTDFGKCTREVKIKKVSVKQLKNLFDKISKNTKTINYESFELAVHSLYLLIFGDFDPRSQQHRGHFEQWLCIDTDQSFRLKMQQFGVYIPKNPTKTSSIKKFKHIEPKYLKQIPKNCQTVHEASPTTNLSLIRENLPIKLSNKKKEETKSSKSWKSPKNISPIDLSQLLGIHDQTTHDDPDDYLTHYQNKGSIGAIRRIDQRIQKYIGNKNTRIL